MADRSQLAGYGLLATVVQRFLTLVVSALYEARLCRLRTRCVRWKRIAAAVAHGEGMGGWVPLDFVRRSASVEKRAAASDLFVPFDSDCLRYAPPPADETSVARWRDRLWQNNARSNGSRPQWAPPSSCSTCRSRPRARISLEAIVR